MSNATPVIHTPAAEPGKRVHYETGMILRQVDFVTEQAYREDRDNLHNVAQHGYGVVYGLEVSAAPKVASTTATGDVEIRVEFGLGIDRLGRPFRVADVQCASLLDWLRKNVVGWEKEGGGTVYVLGCYAELLDNKVALAGTPCRDDGQEGYSRVKDHFLLKLSLQSPRLPVWEASQRFRDLMSRVVIIPNAATDATAALLAAVENLNDPLPNEIVLDAVTARAALDQASELWARTVLPALMRQEPQPSDPNADPMIPLAALRYTVSGTGANTAVEVDPDDVTMAGRPVLLHTQLYQGFEAVRYANRRGDGGSARAARTLPVATITPLRRLDATGNVLFEVWFHIDQGWPDALLGSFGSTPPKLTVQVEGAKSLEAQAVPVDYRRSNSQNRPGLFEVRTEYRTAASKPDLTWLHFVFDLTGINVRAFGSNRDSTPVSDYMANNNVMFDGYADTPSPRIIVYVRNPFGGAD